MRLLYNRYYKEQQRGFTEEEFWAVAEEVAGQPMTEIRRLVDTTAEIDYDNYLREAGLYVDTENWAILRVPNPNPQQQAFLKAMNLYGKFLGVK